MGRKLGKREGKRAKKYGKVRADTGIGAAVDFEFSLTPNHNLNSYHLNGPTTCFVENLNLRMKNRDK